MLRGTDRRSLSRDQIIIYDCNLPLDSSLFGARNVLGDESDALRLGELAGLTVANEADPLTYDVSIYTFIEFEIVYKTTC